MSNALIVIVVVMLFILLLAVLALLFRKPPQEITDLAAKAAVITDKIERVESIPSEVNALKVELSKLSERVAGVQQNQNNVTQNISRHQTLTAMRVRQKLPRLYTSPSFPRSEHLMFSK
jgi:hypothetical protein